MTNRARTELLRILLPAALILSLCFSGAAWAGADGRCVRADIPAPVILPDGAERPAGSLKICLDAAYSPVAGLHTLSYEDRIVGLFVSQRGTGRLASDEPAQPYLVFNKNDRGALTLQGYAWPGNESTIETFSLGAAEVTSHWLANAASAPDANSTRVFLAANRF
ncbi:MAG: hypothetical protein GY716_01585 [bacterium]|nr:hypothetical protein [bacterium]